MYRRFTIACEPYLLSLVRIRANESSDDIINDHSQKVTCSLDRFHILEKDTWKLQLTDTAVVDWQ